MSGATRMDPWYGAHLVCPRDHLDVRHLNDELSCAAGHTYPIVDGIPVMLLDDVVQTMGIADASLACAKARRAPDDDVASSLYLETLGLSDDEKRGIRALALAGRSRIDPVVTYAIAGTNGLMYKHLIGTLDEYPIPDLRLPAGTGETLLDIGCNWGRWSIAAARKGYAVVGIDPSLGSIMAARRVNDSLGLSIRYVVGDARHLPFRANSFQYAFSYSVLQHLSRDDVRRVVSEVARTLRSGGTSLVQMPTVLGVRCLYHQATRRFREARGFEVRYWTIPSLRELFSRAIGPTRISADCYFAIGLQKSDRALMPPALKLVVAVSEWLRGASRIVPVLTYVADSVYVAAVKA